MKFIFFLILFFHSLAPCVFSEEAIISQEPISSEKAINPERASLEKSIDADFISKFFKPYQEILNKYVDFKGRVKYRELVKEKEKLDEFVNQLKVIDAYDAFNIDQRKSFWINVYNLLSIKTVLNHYPIEKNSLENTAFPENSIRQISGAFTGLKYEVVGKIVTLDFILHSIFRNEFNDTRVLFVLNNSSLGAGNLSNMIFESKDLDQRLDTEVKYFLVDPAKFFIDKNEMRLLASPIFTWYKKDFIKHYHVDFKRYTREVANYLGFISKYISAKDVELIKSRYFKFTYLEYDWALNEKLY